jgi:hypothetical protein
MIDASALDGHREDANDRPCGSENGTESRRSGQPSVTRHQEAETR